MLPDRVSNPGPLTYESGALPIALRGPVQRRGSTIALPAWTSSRRAKNATVTLLSFQKFFVAYMAEPYTCQMQLDKFVTLKSWHIPSKTDLKTLILASNFKLL